MRTNKQCIYTTLVVLSAITLLILSAFFITWIAVTAAHANDEVTCVFPLSTSAAKVSSLPANASPSACVSSTGFVTTTSDSQPIYYRLAKPPGSLALGAPSILMLHGFPSTGEIFRAQIDSLCLSAVVVAIDLRGHGNSTKQGPFTTYQLASDAAAVIQALGLGKPTVVGNSMGGAAALQFAATYPNLLSKLMTVGTTAKLVNDENWTFGLDGALLGQIFGLVNTAGVEVFAGAFYGAIYVDSTCDTSVKSGLISDGVQTTIKYMNDSSLINAIAGDLGASWDSRAVLGNIAAPTLVTAGTNDLFQITAAEYLRANIPRAYIHEFPEAGHFPHKTRSAMFTQTLSNFVFEKDIACNTI